MNPKKPARKRKEYICKNCGYRTHKKSNYLSHQLRKTPCVSNKDVLYVPLNYYFNNSISDYSISENSITDNSITNNSNNSIINNDKLKLKILEKRYQESLLSNKDLLNKLKNKEIENAKLLSSNNILLKRENTYKESIAINVNYIVINEYGKEDVSYIDMNKILKECETLAHMIAKQVTLKHFHKHKKNHNLKLGRNIVKIYNKGVWEIPGEPTKNKLKLFIVNELIRKGIININKYKNCENIIFENNKEKRYEKDKRYLERNIPLTCMFNPEEAKNRLLEVQEQRKIDQNPDDPKWNKIEQKYKKEIKAARKQLDVKKALISNLTNSISKKYIKAGMVPFKNYE